MQTKFETGTAFLWQDGEDDEDPVYGVVLYTENGVAVAARVMEADADTKCYDEGGSSYDEDRHNVRLDCCPPPFRFLCAFNEHGMYAYGDPDDMFTFDAEHAEDFGISVIDEGELVPEYKIGEILDHPWRDEKEKGVDGDIVEEPDVTDEAPVHSSLFEAMMAQNAATDAAWAEKESDEMEYG